MNWKTTLISKGEAMKRLIKITIIAAVMICMTACFNKDENRETVVNPLLSYESLSEINNAIGVSLIKLPFSSISDETYYVIGGIIAEYNFIANDYEYCFRASRMLDEDISGIYIDGEPAFSDFSESLSVNQNDDTFKVGRFEVDGVQYSISVMDEGKMDYSSFSEFVEKTRDSVNRNVYSDKMKSLEGSYFDSSSPRFQAEVSVVDDNIIIDVIRANSTKEYEEWVMFVRYEGDRLVYDEVLHTTITSSKGEEQTVQEYDYGAGYFEIVDSDLYWTGSGNERTDKCVFEKSE